MIPTSRRLPLRTVRVLLATLAVGSATVACASAGSGLAPAPAAPADLAVLPGDRVTLWVWEEPEMAREYAVDENGLVVLPKLGPVHVAGLTPDAVRDSIRDWYAATLTTSAIDVRVLRRIGVRGEVRAPSLYWVDPTLTAQDVITLAGGLTPDADEDELYLMRDGHRYELGRGFDRAVPLASGDQLLIGRRSWFSLNAPFVVSTSIGVVTTAIGIYLATK